jgi:hypothetical protein
MGQPLAVHISNSFSKLQKNVTGNFFIKSSTFVGLFAPEIEQVAPSEFFGQDVGHAINLKVIDKVNNILTLLEQL